MTPSEAQLAEIEALREQRDAMIWAAEKLQTERDEALAALRDARAENERLNHRLWPSQGEGYANEVERQRVVIDGMKHAALTAQAGRDAARAETAELRARIEALCDEAERDRNSVRAVWTGNIRAALSPAEETE